MREDRFLRACHLEPTDTTPVWLMRQAGRYLPEYRAIREKHPFLTMCKTPELAAEVTLQPVDRFAIDAAIIFADILLPLEGMGLGLEFAQGEGPVIHNPVRRREDAEQLRIIEPEEDLPYVLQAIRLVRGSLAGRVPLIGFAGAPFTLASYVIEGGASREYRRCKSLMWQEPETWHLLMDKLARVTLKYLQAQIAAGAQAVQLFDSWVGSLSPEDYTRYVLPHSRYVLQGLRGSGVPVIHFANNASSYIERVREAGGDVIGLDWRIDIGEARARLGSGVAVQGNLDPFLLFAPPEEIRGRVRHLLERAGGEPGHIFNLGHGIHKETPVEHVRVLVDAVHEYGASAHRG